MQLIMMTVTGVVVIAVLVAAVKIINSNDNTLEWSHLVSTKGAGGTQYADWDKIGKGCAVILCVWATAVYIYNPKMEATGLAAVLAVVLAYLGGVSGYAATLRARQGTITTVTEPAQPIPAKVTEIKTPPIAAKEEGNVR